MVSNVYIMRSKTVYKTKHYFVSWTMYNFRAFNIVKTQYVGESQNPAKTKNAIFYCIEATNVTKNLQTIKNTRY